MRAQNDTRSDSQKPPLMPANFYLKATMVCSDCRHEEDVLINYDTEVFHECNKGNVRTIVPELPLHPDSEVRKQQKILLKEVTDESK